jgi:quercetin dioxygenase-like cupin family protein
MNIVTIDEKHMCRTRSGNKIYWLITSEMGAPGFELRYIEIPPGGKSSYGHHPHEHEVFIVSGRGKIAGEFPEAVLSPGTAVFVPGNEEHQWINTSESEPFGFICVVPRGAEAESKPPCS